MLRRGAAKRCARCGGGRLFRGWFRMVPRCPSCGYRFEREPGFFAGAYFVNFPVTEAALALVAVAYLVGKAVDADTSPAVALVAALVVAVVVPVAFYPFSRTIWAAIDLAMTPMELDEIVAAEDALAVDDDHQT